MCPKITVFIPMYNAESYISDTIHSVLNQTFRDFELLIIDDGSVDHSVEVVNSFDDNRVRLVLNEKNMGLPFTRNRGLELSRGEYIALLDADDLSMPRRLEFQYRFLEENPQYGAVCSKTDFLIDGEIIKSLRLSSKVENVNLFLMFGCFVPNPTAMIRKKIIDTYNLKYNAKYFVAQDYGFWVEFSKYSQIAKLPDALVVYRKGHRNITYTSLTNKAKERKRIIDEIRTNCIKHYTDSLTEHDIKIINTVFSDPPLTIDLDMLLNLRGVIDKIMISPKIDSKKNYVKKTKLLYVNKVIDQDIKLSKKTKLLAYRFIGEGIDSIFSSYFILFARSTIRLVKSLFKKK